MTIKVESFIALENSLALRLTSTLRAVTSELYPNIQKAIKDGNWPVADRLTQGLDLSPVFDLNEPYIAYLSQMAVLFGASRVTDSHVRSDSEATRWVRGSPRRERHGSQSQVRGQENGLCQGSKV